MDDRGKKDGEEVMMKNRPSWKQMQDQNARRYLKKDTPKIKEKSSYLSCSTRDQ